MKASQLLAQRRALGLSAADIPKNYSVDVNRPDPELVRSWLEKSCAAQGVPVLITDPLTVSRVAVLFRQDHV